MNIDTSQFAAISDRLDLNERRVLHILNAMQKVCDSAGLAVDAARLRVIPGGRYRAAGTKRRSRPHLEVLRGGEQPEAR